MRENDDLESQCIKTFQKVFSRDPQPYELAECIDFQQRQRKLIADQGQADPAFAALSDMCRAMFNSNQFLYVD